MREDLVQKVKSHPKYAELIGKRRALAWLLSFLMLAIYFSFILLITYEPQLHLMGKPIGDGAITTWGIPIGIAVILSAFVLTGIYVYRANGEFDDLNNQIKEDVKK
ncbi:MAG: hypothetical protein RIT27_324 [Pseudomonadota bacterium]|jgi:uncharacterized membrane protein (DUF485 family)